MEITDIQQDSGRYLQEYVESLENLPSEIVYHFREIQSRNEQDQAIERRMYSKQHDLARIHRQWCRQTLEKQEKPTNEGVLIREINDDYSKLQELSGERLQIADEALQLMDRHLHRLRRDLDELDKNNPDAAPVHHRYDHRRRKSSLMLDRDDGYDDAEDEDMIDEEEGDEDEDEEEEDHEFDYEAMMTQRQQKQKRKEARDGEANELYCYCQQVSFGQMVACDSKHCPYEWFHMECVGLDATPKGEWICDTCKESNSRKKEMKKLKRKLFLS